MALPFQTHSRAPRGLPLNCLPFLDRKRSPRDGRLFPMRADLRCKHDEAFLHQPILENATELASREKRHRHMTGRARPIPAAPVSNPRPRKHQNHDPQLRARRPLPARDSPTPHTAIYTTRLKLHIPCVLAVHFPTQSVYCSYCGVAPRTTASNTPRIYERIRVHDL